MTILEQIFFNLGPIIFALAGFFVALYVYIKKSKAQPMVCPLNGECDVVTTSKYSKFLGVRVELLGLIYYLFIALVYTLHNLIPWLLSETVIFLITGITIGAFVFSVYLIFIQAFILKKWCTWCIFSAGFSTFIFLTAVFGAQIDLKGLLSEHRTLIIVLHALAGAVGVGTATITDILFFKFLKDYKISESEHDLMNTLSNVIWFALGLIVVTGIGLYLPESERLLNSSKFITKVTAVFVLIVNGVLLNLVVSPKLMQITFGEEHQHIKGELHFLRKLSFALGAISISSWYLVFILGSLKKIPVTPRMGIILYFTLLLVAVFGSQLFDRYMVEKRKKELQENK